MRYNRFYIIGESNNKVHTINSFNFYLFCFPEAAAEPLGSARGALRAPRSRGWEPLLYTISLYDSTYIFSYILAQKTDDSWHFSITRVQLDPYCSTQTFTVCFQKKAPRKAILCLAIIAWNLAESFLNSHHSDPNETIRCPSKVAVNSSAARSMEQCQ